MKKIGKIFTLIGVVLVIVGSIIFIKALGDNNWSFESLNSSRLVETTFDFNDDIYGEEMTVEFLKKTRAQKRFEDMDALKKAIALDEIEVKNFFAQK